MEYLGSWMTRNIIQPMNKKVEAIINMMPPISTKQVILFIILVNYNRHMSVRWSHLPQPLTALTSSKVKFKWIDVEQKAFDGIKRAVSHDTLLSYLPINQHFVIHTDASDYQIGAVISQEGKPIAFYSQKLTGQ